jgi:hypothetical protein
MTFRKIILEELKVGGFVTCGCLTDFWAGLGHIETQKQHDTLADKIGQT